jgi:hypothetical protein
VTSITSAHRTNRTEWTVEASTAKTQALKHGRIQLRARPFEGGKEKVKMRLIASLVIATAAATVGLAPIASADSTVRQTPGNAEVTAHPGAAADHAAQVQQPFGGDLGALIFHH